MIVSCGYLAFNSLSNRAKILLHIDVGRFIVLFDCLQCICHCRVLVSEGLSAPDMVFRFCGWNCILAVIQWQSWCKTFISRTRSTSLSFFHFFFFSFRSLLTSTVSAAVWKTVTVAKVTLKISVLESMKDVNKTKSKTNPRVNIMNKTPENNTQSQSYGITVLKTVFGLFSIPLMSGEIQDS